ncbi:MAG: hypothetical protein EZS28_011903, partial [Streblomastix strix]
IPVLHQMLNKLIRHSQSPPNLNPYFGSKAQPPIAPDSLIDEKVKHTDPSAFDCATTDAEFASQKDMKHSDTQPLYIFKSDDVWRHLNVPLPLLQTSLQLEDIDKRIPIHIPLLQRALNYVVKEEEEEEGRAVVVVEQGSELRKEILDSDDQLDKNQSGDVNKAINEEIDGSDEKDEDQEENKPSEDA